jgi:hypothetical protein
LAVGLLISALGLAWFGRAALQAPARIDWWRGRWGLLLVALGAGLWALAAFRG